MVLRSYWHAVEAMALAMAVYLTTTHAGGMRKDEILCEEALARLGDCCPQESLASVRCTFFHGCMGHDESYPDIGPEDADCIRNASCDQLVSSGLCERIGGTPPAGELYPDWQVCQ